MFCRSVSWFVCTFVAVAIATGYSGQGSNTGCDSEVAFDHLRTDNLGSFTADPLQKPNTAVDLGALLDAGDGAVVALVSGDTRLLAHRAVLAARSPVFQRILQDEAIGEVAIPDVEGPVLRQLLAYLYTLQAPQLPGMAPQLLAAADQYGLPALKADCEQQLAAQLSLQTAAATAVFAVRHSYDSLRKAAIAYIRDHIFQVMATQGWADAIECQPDVWIKVIRLLSKSPPETSSPASAASSATPTIEPQSVHSSRGQTPAPTTSDSSVSSGSANVCVCSTAPAEGGSSPDPATQPHSDHTGHQTPTTAAPTTVAQTIASTEDVHISFLPSTAPTESGSSPDPATQPHSDHSGHQTPTTAAPTTVAQTIASTEDDHISFLRSLPPEEKTRRLMEAVKKGAVGELEALLAAGADVGARDENTWRRTALHWAALRGHVEVARRLLAAGAAVDARESKWQATPLHYAAGNGRAAVVRLLLANNADHGARSNYGRTPLHWAAEWGHTEAAAALLAAGADTAARDKQGHTPLDIARWYKHQQVVQLLQGDSGLTAGTTPE